MRIDRPQVFNQEFIVDERYNVTKELGQGAYGIVWYDSSSGATHTNTDCAIQCGYQQPDRRGRRDQEGHKRLQQEDPCEACPARDQAAPALQRQVYIVPIGCDTTNTCQATAT
jgi:hypothetical protein